MSKLKVTNLVKLYILFLINEKPRHGYEIIKEVERKMKKKVSAGEVYPFLKILKNCGYVVSKRVGEKKVYSLTQNGKKICKKNV